jgi:hypothetical protein
MEKCENKRLKVLEFCDNVVLKLLEKCDITFVIKVKKLNCYVTSMDHGRF